MTVKSFFFSLVLLIILGSKAFAAEFSCSLEKGLPRVVMGCEGEACGFYHYDRALKDITLFEKPDAKSKKVGVVKRCEELQKLEPIMIVKSYGRARVAKVSPKLKNLKVSKGDIVPIQQYGGEGYLFLCVGNNKDIDAAMDEIGNEDKKIADVNIIDSTKVESWIKLKSKAGITGYAPRSGETVMWYSTIDESKLCDPAHKNLLKNL